jgi:hypothetical protein
MYELLSCCGSGSTVLLRFDHLPTLTELVEAHPARLLDTIAANLVLRDTLHGTRWLVGSDGTLAAEQSGTVSDDD